MPETDRYPAIAEEALEPGSDQKQLHELMTSDLTKLFGEVFTFQDAKTKALVGLFSHFLYLPAGVFEAFHAQAVVLASVPGFSRKCREIAILTVGEHYGATFELYSHARIAKQVGLSDTQIEDVMGGRPPSGATEEEITTWEVARALSGAGSGSVKGPLSEELWTKAERTFGKTTAGALIHYTGFYAYTCIILNGMAASVPAGEKVWPVSNTDGNANPEQ
ncbi:hypothetical protein DRE_04424 [Drechslerella stenobrocha 248]|uniref:Carboxymuconolactone decarboxylase-like domain-containing protein n=1 Tax=Drechslerella stenobrocha 248 TaxID=1043628 RepID=W7I1X1_9PEZI|nr:hypothetical protein DRE_04424 [Drechslerella stenobrocha 248]